MKKRRQVKRVPSQIAMNDVKVSQSPNPSLVRLSSQNISSSIPVLSGIKVKQRLGGGNFGDVYLGDWSG